MLNYLIGLVVDKLVNHIVELVEKKLNTQLAINKLSSEAIELQKEVDLARTDEERSAVLKKIANLHKFTVK